MRDERRRSTRYGVAEATGSFRLAGSFRLIDVSLNGFGIEGNLRLQKGQVYRGRLEWAGQVIDVKGRVAWTRLVGTAKSADGDVLPVYHAGIELEPPINQGHGELQRLIEAATTFRKGDRLFGRYRPEGETTDIALDAEIAIRKVSRTGMLIVSPAVAEIGAVLPFELAFAGDSFAAPGRVVTCEARPEPEAEEPGSWEIGVAFEELDEGARQCLEQALERLAETSQDGT